MRLEQELPESICRLGMEIAGLDSKTVKKIFYNIELAELDNGKNKN